MVIANTASIYVSFQRKNRSTKNKVRSILKVNCFFQLPGVGVWKYHGKTQQLTRQNLQTTKLTALKSSL